MGSETDFYVARAAKWFREQGFAVFYAQPLRDVKVRYLQILKI